MINSIFKKYAKQKESSCNFPRLLGKILLSLFKYTLLPKSNFLLPSFMCPEEKTILKLRKLVRLSMEMEERKKKRLIKKYESGHNHPYSDTC